MDRKSKFIFNLIVYLAAFLTVLPMIILVLWSFSKRWPWPYIFPREFSFRGINSVMSLQNSSLTILLSSIVLSLTVTLVTLLLSIPAARALGFYDFKGKTLFKVIILSPLIVSPVAVGLGIQSLFIRLGLANTFLGVVIIHLLPCLPYGIRLLTNVFEIIGEGMELQARTLGASKFQVFFNVTLPLAAPGLISAASLVFIVSFSQYFLTFLIGGGNIITFSMVMFPFIQSGDRTLASSYSLVFIASTLILLILMEKAIRNYYDVENHFFI